jgi:hypothetical protein
MEPIPVTPQILSVALRIIWVEPPERALADPVRFSAYAVAYARHEDMRVIRLVPMNRQDLAHASRAAFVDKRRRQAAWNAGCEHFPCRRLDPCCGLAGSLAGCRAEARD